jgi:CRP-like cAMP-binding protein
MPANIKPSPLQNQLLAALPDEEFTPIAPFLEWVKLPLGEMLYDPGETIEFAYFPTTAVISLHYVMESGASAETAGVGREGMIGVSLFMGGASTPSSAVVQIAGEGYRMNRQQLVAEFNRAGTMQSVLLRYTQALITQMTQMAACNRHHSIEQRLCRWLLSTLDRVPASDFIVTHEMVAAMLGVRREGVSEAAARMQHAGFIRYRRGHLAVLERSGLENRACECYAVVRKELERLGEDIPRPRTRQAQFN